MDLSVVVPVFNEQENIQPLIEEIDTALNSHPDYGIIYVGDGSLDTLGNHATNCGQRPAVHTDTWAATAPWITTRDGAAISAPARCATLVESGIDPVGAGQPVLQAPPPGRTAACVPRIIHPHQNRTGS